MSGTRAPKTIVVYDITGQTDYTIPFEYLARKFVVVTLIGQDRKVLTLNTDYRFTTKTTIGLSDPSPVGYDKIEIRRFTSATDRLVDFHDGSILRAYDLNLSQIQTLHVAEEARDLAGDSLAVNDNGDLDARGRKIVNLGDAEDDSDAVNYGQLKEFDNSTFYNAQSAKSSADAAKVSENKAKSSENRAVTAETRAVASAGTAVQAAMDANSSKVDAGLSETNAKASETNAKASETNAKASEIKAEQEASKLQSYNDIALALEPITTDSVHFNRDLEITNTSDNSKIKVTQIKEKIDAMIGSECQFPPMPSGITPSDYHVAKKGSLLKRLEYPSLFQWANSKGLIVTEAKWQELKASSHGGAVAVYSDGDGSTTFRVPSIGQYGMIQRPTPNSLAITEAHFIGYTDQNKAHTHTRGSMEISGQFGDAISRTPVGLAGAFFDSKQVVTTSGAAGSPYDGYGTGFQASRSWTGATSSDGGSEVTMKHMWCSIWIYAGLKVG